ncbi:XrtA/PEP-CTERM system TPR-repeat protein PrsT [Catenovulum maritimum]|nr:XrtA/PEP-CTERM system TPR-repeat protein PrsT [Catenovulum maritimum]
MNNNIGILGVCFFCLALSGCFSSKSTDTYIAESKAYIANNDTSAAIIALKNAVASEPSNAEARYLLGNEYLKIGSYLQAQKEIEIAYELTPTEDIALSYAKVLYLVDSFTESLSVIDGIKPENLSLDELHYYKYLNLFALGEIDEALSVLSLNKAKQEPYISLYKAIMLLEQKKGVEAYTLTKNIAEAHQNHLEFVQVHARLANLNQDFGVAAEFYEHYSRLQPEQHIIKLMLADAYIKDKNFKPASLILDKLLKEFPSNGYSNLFRAMVHFEQQQCKQAHSRAVKAIQAGLSTNTSRLIAGTCAYKIDKLEEAYSHLIALQKISTLDESIKRLLSVVQLRLGYSDDAVDNLMSLTETSEADSSLFIEAGMQAYKSGNESVAKAMVERSKALSPSKIEDLTKLGLLDFSVSQDDSLLRDLSDTDNANGKSRLALIAVYLRQKKFSDALKEAEKWLALDGENVEALNVAGYSAMNLTRDDLAASYFEKSLSIKSDNTMAITFFADKYIAQKDLENAQKMLSKLIGSEQASLINYTYYYAGYKRMGLEEQAIQVLASKYKSNKENADFLYLYTKALFSEKKYHKVIDLLRSTSANKIYPEQHWYMLAESYVALKELEAAFRAFELWTKSSPSSIRPWLRLLSLSEMTMQYSKGSSIVRQAKVHFPDDVKLDIYDINFRLKLKNTTGVEKLIEKVELFDPNLVTLWRFKSELALLLNKHDDSVLALTEYYKLKPTNKAALSVYQLMKSDIKTKNRSYEFLTTHAEKFPQRAKDMWFILGNDYLSTDPNKAKSAYLKSIDLNDKNYIAHNNLAWLYSQSGEMDKAIEHGLSANKLSPNNPQIMDTLGMVYLKNKEYSKAYGYLFEAFQVDSDNTAIASNLIEVLIDITDKSQLNDAINLIESSPVGSEASLSEKLNDIKAKL